MKSLRLLDRRAGYSLASIGLLLGVIAPAAIPAFASAAVLSSRSVKLSNSAADGSGVSYDVKFTAPTSISGTGATKGGVVIDFCDDSPLVGTACNAPTGVDTTSVSVSGVKYAGSAAGSNGTVAASDSNTSVTWTAGADFTGGQTLEMVLGGIHNPTAAETFYARIITYANATDLGGYNAPDDLGSPADTGAVALSTTTTVGVTAYVLESMTFCVTGTSAPAYDCTGTLNSPSLTLGEPVNGSSQLALDTGHVSTGTDYMLLSTNASSGATVNLKSSTTGCGGLKLNGSGTCGVPAQASNGSTVVAGTADFGVKLGSLASATSATNPSGTLQAATGSHYDGSNYYLDYTSGDASGVTSTYGSPFVDTNSAQVSNKTLPFTFGATIGNTTPAGIYSATLDLVATGTF